MLSFEPPSRRRVLATLTLLLVIPRVARSAPGQKVAICHFPPDDPTVADHLTVNQSAVSTHINRHNDAICTGNGTDCCFGGAEPSVCTDFETDQNNCGACGVICPVDTLCTEGSCRYRNPCMDDLAACPPSPGSSPLRHATADPQQSGRFDPVASSAEGANEELPPSVGTGPLRGPLAPTVSATDLASPLEPMSSASPLEANAAPLQAVGRPVVFVRNTSVRGTVVPTWQAADPSGADNGQTVLWSSNSQPLGALSTDGGSGFAGLDPTTIFPSGPAKDSAGNLLDAGIDGDQIVIYVPQIDRFIWLMQFMPANNRSKLRLAAASTTQVAAGATAWTYWDLTSGLFGSTTWFDYPDLSFGTNYLYLSINDVGVGRRVMRIPLAHIAAGGTIGIDYTDPPDGARASFAHLTQNASDTAYWAGPEGNSRMRIFSMRDSEGFYSWRSVDINSWCDGDASSVTPSGKNWLAFNSGNRGVVLGLTRRFNFGTGQMELWFAWTAGHKLLDGQSCGFDQTHVEIAVLRESDFGFVRQTQVWNPMIAFAYPALASNSDGEVAMSIGFGGGAYEQNSAVGFAGDSLIYPTTASTSSFQQFGDYLTIRNSPAETFCSLSPPVPGCTRFSACGYGVDAVGVDPRYTVFGRLPCGDSAPQCSGACPPDSPFCLSRFDGSCSCGIP